MGPDWTVISVAVVPVIGALAAAFVLIRQRSSHNDGNGPQHQLRLERDKAATVDSARTLDDVFRLVENLQQENDRKDARIGALEAKVEALEAEIRTLRMQP